MRLIIFCVFILLATILETGYSTEMVNPEKHVIILLGPPGSGKGTQATRLTKHLNIPHISTGDLFRENISKNTDLGRKAQEYMNAGKLVPDSLVIEMLSVRLAQPDCINGYLLDGFPRTLSQAESLDNLLSKQTHLIVISLEIADDVVIKRMEGRLLCKQCGHIHHKISSPPSKEKVCDKCGGELYQRPDDKLEVVQERLRVYQAQTKPLIEFYLKKGILRTVDGEQNPEIVFKTILRYLSEKPAQKK